MKKNKNAEKRCINCGRIIVDETNKTGLCPKCTKEGVAIGAAAVAVVPGVVAGVKNMASKLYKDLLNWS